MLGVAGLLAWQQEQPQVVGSLLWAQEPREQGAKAVAQAPAEQKPTPLPEDIEKAWAAAGAKIGWMRVQMPEKTVPGVPIPPDVYEHRSMLGCVPRDQGQKGDIPAFRLRAWQAGLLPKLPEPQVPFGLDLTELALTDRWLEDLRGLKNLQALKLTYRRVTGAGLKELAGLKNLQVLFLYHTKANRRWRRGIAKGAPELRHPQIRPIPIQERRLTLALKSCERRSRIATSGEA
jgi:hypothetical protein